MSLDIPDIGHPGPDYADKVNDALETLDEGATTAEERLDNLSADDVVATLPAGFDGSTVQEGFNGLGTAARLNVGQGPGTVALGNDPRFGDSPAVLTPKVISTATYEIEAEDVGRSLEFTNVLGCAVSAPSDAAASILAGVRIPWQQLGGPLFFEHGGPVVVTSKKGFWATGQFASGYIGKRLANSWNVDGDLQEEGFWQGANSIRALGSEVVGASSATSIASGEVTPREGSLIVAVFETRASDMAPVNVTSTFQNITAWTTFTLQPSTSSVGLVVAYARCTGRQAAGRVTVTYGTAMTLRNLKLLEVTGVDATPVTQSKTGSGSSATPSLTLDGAPAANSLVLAILGIRDAAGGATNVTEDAEYTRFHQSVIGSSTNTGVMDISYDATTPDTTIGWATGGPVEPYGAVALEIKPGEVAAPLVDAYATPGLDDWVSWTAAISSVDPDNPVLADGDPIALMNNPFGADPAQATGANRPVWDTTPPIRPTKPAMRFDGNQFLHAAQAIAAPATFVAVAAFDDIAGNIQRLMGGATATNRGMGINGENWINRFGSESVTHITSTVTGSPHGLHADSGLHLFRVFYAAGSTTFLIDERPILMLPTPGGLTSFASWCVGAGYDGVAAANFFRGWVWEHRWAPGDIAADPNWADVLQVLDAEYGWRPEPADHHVIFTGQSLCTGPAAAGAPSETWTDDKALMLDVPIKAAPAQNWAFQTGLTSESPRCAFVKTVRRAMGLRGDADFTISSTIAGYSGHDYDGLKKGSIYYEGAMNVVEDPECVDNVTAVLFLHGEADQASDKTTAEYFGFLEEWFDDYTTDILATTPQEDGPRGYCYQTRSRTGTPNTPRSALAQLQAHEEGLLTCALPLYWLPPENGTDPVHVSADGAWYIGEILARAYIKEVIDGDTWECLRPLSAARVGNQVTIEFEVPVAPLVFDTTTIDAEDDMGFTWHDSTSSASVTGVALGGNGTSVVLTLSGVPTGADPHVGYAYTTQNGNLRDSDPYVSWRDATPLRNWCMAFYQPVTV